MEGPREQFFAEKAEEAASEEDEQEELKLIRTEVQQTDKMLIQLAAGELAKFVCRTASETQAAIAVEGQQSHAAWKDIHSTTSNIRKVRVFCLHESSLACNQGHGM